MAIILLIKTEDEQVTELPMFGKISFGRSGSSDYKIADTKMSGNHCSFEVTGQGQLLFMDLGSSNGSFLNNSLTTKTMVRVHDVIRIGNTLIKIDEKRLTPTERLAIGSSLVQKKSDKTLPELKTKTSINESGNDNEPKKRTIVLNQNLKAKKKPVINAWGSSENIIDQEESSGQTKFLKLDRLIGKDKKKK